MNDRARHIEPPRHARHVPEPGEWPCQTPHEGRELPTPLVAFLYVLLRDGAQSPGDVEQLAIHVGSYMPETVVDYTNPHLLSYARSMAAALLGSA